MAYILFTKKFVSQLAYHKIEKKNIVWSREFNEGYSDARKTFIDKSTGWAYNVDPEDNIIQDSFLMSYNMYEKHCWSCGKEREVECHAKRCFFCSDCCTLRYHPNPHV